LVPSRLARRVFDMGFMSLDASFELLRGTGNITNIARQAAPYADLSDEIRKPLGQVVETQ
jgi:hypothetical protein